MYMELRLKELCTIKGITQKELAFKLDVTEMTLSRASKGNTSMQLLEKIAEALNVEVWELFTSSTEKKQNIITCPKCGTALEIKEKESYNVDEDPLLQ